MMDLDFIGFTYNGKHSWHDLGIYRTSDGSRYNDTLTPSLNDKTAEVPGGNGQYYFYTRAKAKTFSISYAFDSLTESGLRLLKQVFNGQGIHDLIFDETPYKTWSAKVTGNSQIKHLCFTDSNGDRVYKGEGSISFTCYWPYARTSKLNNYSVNSRALSSRDKVVCDLFTQGGNNYPLINNMRSELTIVYSEQIDNEWGNNITATIAIGATKIFNRPTWIKQLSVASNAASDEYITLCEDKFYYTVNKTFEYSGQCDGRNINHYSPILFPNKREWAPDSGLFITPKNGENYGDIPASFVYTNDAIVANTEIVLDGVGTITILEDCNEMKWDSKTGLVTGLVDGVRRPVYYSGNSLVEIPVGNNVVSTSSPVGGKLEYNYWYY